MNQKLIIVIVISTILLGLIIWLVYSKTRHQPNIPKITDFNKDWPHSENVYFASGKEHHTEKYRFKESNIFVVRRGDEFIIMADPSSKTKVSDMDISLDAGRTGIRLQNVQNNYAVFNSPINSDIGIAKIRMGASTFRVYLVFNPYHKLDDVYMADQSLLQEYVQNEHGFVFQGDSIENCSTTLWDYNQFEGVIIEMVMKALDGASYDKTGTPDKIDFSSPIEVSRAMTLLINSDMLSGNWGSNMEQISVMNYDYPCNQDSIPKNPAFPGQSVDCELAPSPFYQCQENRWGNAASYNSKTGLLNYDTIQKDTGNTPLVCGFQSKMRGGGNNPTSLAYYNQPSTIPCEDGVCNASLADVKANLEFKFEDDSSKWILNEPTCVPKQDYFCSYRNKPFQQTTETVFNLLQMYRSQGADDSVEYGQCWVFGAVLLVSMRCLGIPCRQITNFQSAHPQCDDEMVEGCDNPFAIPQFDAIMKEDTRGYSNGSIWNFHSWNDAWMKRPDLPSNYSEANWQTIDATPQSDSYGLNMCGPTPLLAVKNKDNKILYDTPFIASEVNYDIRKSNGKLVYGNAQPVTTMPNLSNEIMNMENPPKEKVLQKLASVYQKATKASALRSFMASTEPNVYIQSKCAAAGSPVNIQSLLFSNVGGEATVHLQIFQTLYTSEITDNTPIMNFKDKIQLRKNDVVEYSKVLNSSQFLNLNSQYFRVLINVTYPGSHQHSDFSSLYIPLPNVVLSMDRCCTIRRGETKSVTLRFQNPYDVSVSVNNLSIDASHLTIESESKRPVHQILKPMAMIEYKATVSAENVHYAVSQGYIVGKVTLNEINKIIQKRIIVKILD